MKTLNLQKKEIFLFLIIVTYIVYRFFLISSRFYDHDELEHLNATWNLANGHIPYLNFFEHHFPWLYHSSTLLFTIFNNVATSANQALKSILFARYYMQFYLILSSIFLYRAVRLFHSRLSSILFLTFYFSSTPLISKSIEFRGDVPALMFFSISLYYLIVSFKKIKKQNIYFSCFFFGVAIMFTQKYLVILPAFLMALTYFFFKIGMTPKQILKTAIVSLLFLLIPFTLTAIFYYSHNALNEFIHYNLLLNLKWNNYGPHWDHSIDFIKTSLVHFSLSLISILFVLYIYLKEKLISQIDLVFGIFYIWFIISLYLIPISALQFYIIFIPAMCYFSSILLGYIFDKTNFTPIVIVFIIMISNDILLRRKPNGYRRIQDSLISYILKNTNENEKVFVGNPNYALYRPSISYYHFIHRGIWLSMNEIDKNKIKKIIKNDSLRPQIISYDYNLRTFFSDLEVEIRKNYEVVKGSTIDKGNIYEYELLVRKEETQGNPK